MSLSNDLDVLFDPSIFFKDYTNYVINKAKKCLGCVCRMSTEICDPFCVIICWARSVLENTCIIWSIISSLLSNISGLKDLENSETIYKDCIS